MRWEWAGFEVTEETGSGQGTVISTYLGNIYTANILCSEGKIRELYPQGRHGSAKIFAVRCQFDGPPPTPSSQLIVSLWR